LWLALPAAIGAIGSLAAALVLVQAGLFFVAMFSFWTAAAFATGAVTACANALSAVYEFCSCIGMTTHSCDDACDKLKTWVWSALVSMIFILGSSVGSAIAGGAVPLASVIAMWGVAIAASGAMWAAINAMADGMTCQNPAPPRSGPPEPPPFDPTV
jgi:hypothetical protein